MFAPKAGAELALAPNIAGPGPAAAEAPPKEKLLVPAGHTKKRCRACLTCQICHAMIRRVQDC